VGKRAPGVARWVRASGVLLAALCVQSVALAAGDPAIAWRTRETAHFRVHYPRSYEVVAMRVSELAEAVHARLSVPLGHAPTQPTEIVLTDDSDDANGSATALPYNTIRLFVTAPDDTSALGDYDDWYLELVTHEYTHILHTDEISGAPAIVNAILGKTIAPNQIQPRWVLEGLAVVNETSHSSAGRLRSSLFDMLLRADVLDDRVARLDQISSQPVRYPQGNLWYLYGSKFLGWLSDVYGPETMRAVSIDYGSTLVPWAINRSIRRVTGRTYEELYEGFVDHLRRRYGEQVRDVEKRGRREGTRLTHHGRSVMYPRFVPPRARSSQEGLEIVYTRSDLDARAGVYRLSLAGESHRDELLARTNDIGPVSFSPDGDLWFSAVVPWKNVYDRSDLFTLAAHATSPDGDEPERLARTHGLRAHAADVSPDGRRIVFTVNHKGTTSLEVADLDERGELRGVRDLVPSAPFDQAYTPRFSPDGSRVAYSAWTAGGYRDIRIVDVATGHVDSLTRDRAMDMQPVWSADGSIVYFSSDRTGIFNIYARDMRTAELRMVTNTDRGALSPAVSDDDKTLVYVGYTTEGYDLYAMALDPSRSLPAPDAPADRPAPLPEPSAIPALEHAYEPWRTLAPRSYAVSSRPGSFGDNAVTLTARGADVVGLHALDASLTIDPKAPGPAAIVAYSYDRLPIDFSARAFQSYAPRGRRENDEDHVYAERRQGLSTGLSYPVRTPFSSHSLGLSYSAAAFGPHAREAIMNPDPYAAAVSAPPHGTLGVLHLGYAFSNVESSEKTAGAVRGVAFDAGFDFADEALGSTATLRALEASVTGYFPLPWGHHVLALRGAGAIASGSYARRGNYFVGGYDLDRSLVDAITSGAFNGGFSLRGYAPSAYVGRAYAVANAEYRAPLAIVDRGPSTLPIYLRRIDGCVFMDYGGAFDAFDAHAFQFFHEGSIVDHPSLHTGVGAELWANLTLGYYLALSLRVGYARGFSAEATSGGQRYLVLSSSF